MPKLRSEYQKLRRQIPVGDAELAQFCLAHHLRFEVDAHWRQRVALYWFPYETLKKAVSLWKRLGV